MFGNESSSSKRVFLNPSCSASTSAYGLAKRCWTAMQRVLSMCSAGAPTPRHCSSASSSWHHERVESSDQARLYQSHLRRSRVALPRLRRMMQKPTL